MTVEKLVEARENLVNYIDRIIAHRDGYHGIDAGKHDAKYIVYMIVESAISTIDHDAKPRRRSKTCFTCATNKGDKDCADHDQSYMAGCPCWKDSTPSAHDDAIRRECAERFTQEWRNAFPALDDTPPEWTITAILGKEAKK